LKKARLDGSQRKSRLWRDGDAETFATPNRLVDEEMFGAADFRPQKDDNF
jgi:post-segregation antitoxin (ccd killing protein)